MYVVHKLSSCNTWNTQSQEITARNNPAAMKWFLFISIDKTTCEFNFRLPWLYIKTSWKVISHLFRIMHREQLLMYMYRAFLGFVRNRLLAAGIIFFFHGSWVSIKSIFLNAKIYVGKLWHWKHQNTGNCSTYSKLSTIKLLTCPPLL